MKAIGAIRGVLVGALALLALLLSGTQEAEGGVFETFVVDTNIDDASKTACTAAANDCSLRGAIIRANANNNDAETDHINFSIGTAGNIPAIGLASALTGIFEPVSIDGSTSPAGRVEVFGSVAASGFYIRASDTQLHKLVINRFPGNGITVDGDGAILTNILLSDNRIGLHQTSNTDQGNGGHGIEVIGVASTTITGNVIGFNNGYGVAFTNAHQGPNNVRNNFIGMSTSGTDIGNDTGGILLLGSGNVTIGGASANDVNDIGGNTGSGIALAGTDTGNVIRNNRIGINVLSNAVPNSAHGISGGTPGLQILNNVISGNAMHGVRLNNAANVTLGENLIGLKITGTQALPNGQDGVHIMGTSTGITIGGSGSARNTISGNTQSGIEIEGAATGDIVIADNRIGTNLAGLAAIANGQGGITATATDRLSILRNIISGNAMHGVLLTDATGTNMTRNLIGLDDTGNGDLGNADAGVRLAGTSSQNFIGSLIPDERNYISANNIGIQVDATATDNVIDSNYIGLNFAGDTTVGNTTGIRILGSATDVGESFSTRNYISGNSVGVEITGASATHNSLHRNVIGLAADDSTPIGNKHGITISDGAADNHFDLNTVAGNTLKGVQVLGDASLRNMLERNLIHDNGGLGIDLGGDGVTANDGSDGDGGPNGFLNFPEVIGAWNNLHGGGDVAVVALDSAPNTAFQITLFRNDACDASGHGEGELPLEDAPVVTDGTGHAEVRIDMDAASWDVGDIVTATATEIIGFFGNTSEFSLCATVLASPPGTPTPTPVGATPTPSPTPTPTGGTSTLTPTPTVTPTATATPTGQPSGAATTTPSPTASGTLRQGDVTCDDDIDDEDVTLLLEYFAGLAGGQQDAPCLDLDEPEPISGFGWGDVNCDEAIDGFDVLLVLLFHAGASLPETGAGCFAVGSSIT